jgi:hypothetical protein
MSVPFRWCALGWAIALTGLVAFSAVAQVNEDSPSHSSYIPGGPVAPPKIEHPFPAVTPGADNLPGRQKLIKSIHSGLGRMAPMGPNKKRDLSDYWVVGIGELDRVSRNADVRFGAMQEQKPIAEYLADYILTQPPQAERMWHVFARFKGPGEAERFLQDLRAQYDAFQEYRATIARIYNARSTRRC